MSEQFKKKLSDWKKRNTKKNPDKPAAEDMSTRDIEELMGVNRPVYRRYKGSYRQR